MTLLDPIERGEAACEQWAAENLRGDIATCSCDREFKLEDGESLSPDPYAIPVCPICFGKWFEEETVRNAKTCLQKV